MTPGFWGVTVNLIISDIFEIDVATIILPSYISILLRFIRIVKLSYRLLDCLVGCLP